MGRRRTPRGCRYWFSFVTFWGTYDVVLADPRRCPVIRGKFGLTDIDARLIYLEHSMPPERLILTFFHEATHAILSGPGDARLFARVIGCSAKEAEDREEEMIVLVTSRLADAFLRTRLVHFPELPEKLGGRRGTASTGARIRSGSRTRRR